MSDIKYRHLSDAELKSRIEQFGTENEQEILLRFSVPNCEDCPHFDDMEREMNTKDAGVRSAIDILEELLE